MVGTFIDEIQQTCPSLSQGDLVRAADVFAKMEDARSGYELLGKLASCSPNDLDTWNRLMEEWTATTAEVVLNELRRRLDLIERLQDLVNVTTTDELHQLQPLFAKGLWMFGPEYEAVDFAANRAMTTVIAKLLGGSESALTSRRPDVVALPDSTVSCYAADRYDKAGEVDGVRKVLVVELKRGGFEIGTPELRQGEDYALELKKANLVSEITQMVVYVLGAALATESAEERIVGTIRVIPMTYDVILKRAHARTFNLQRRLSELAPALAPDADVEEVVGELLMSNTKTITAASAEMEVADASEG
jgi:hypothetical protein